MTGSAALASSPVMVRPSFLTQKRRDAMDAAADVMLLLIVFLRQCAISFQAFQLLADTPSRRPMFPERRQANSETARGSLPDSRVRQSIVRVPSPYLFPNP